jgi:hypothetical protein
LREARRKLVEMGRAKSVRELGQYCNQYQRSHLRVRERE